MNLRLGCDGGKINQRIFFFRELCGKDALTSLTYVIY